MEKLITTYDSLPDGKRRVMQLLSLILVPVTRTTLAECLRKAGISNERGKAYSTQELLPRLEGTDTAARVSADDLLEPLRES